MSINTIEDHVIEFEVRVIIDKFYPLSLLNNVSCVVVYMHYKLVKKNNSHDLAKL